MSDAIPPPVPAQVSDEKVDDNRKHLDATRAKLNEALQSLREIEQKQVKARDESVKLLAEHDAKVSEIANLQATLLSFVSFDKK